MIDRFTGLPIPYGGPPVPAEHRPFLTNYMKWNSKLYLILFGEEFPPPPNSIPLVDLIRFINPYDDLVEPLVKENLHLFWTREKHQQFLNACKFFAACGFHMLY
jgi:hypothetical protein